MSLLIKLRRGQGPFWGPLKRLAQGVLRWHLPVFWLTRPFFSFLYHLQMFLGGLLARLLRFFWSEPLFRSQCASIGNNFRMEFLPFIHGQGEIHLGDDVYFGGKPVFIFGNQAEERPELHIGDHTFLGHLVSISVARSVRLGNHCLLAAGVQIADFDGHPIDAARRRQGEPTPPEGIRPVVIGDDVWIGTSAIILKGVTIGDRSIIGAGAVVTRDVPPDVVVAGNPARVVKHLEPTRSDRQTLLEQTLQ